MLISITNKPNRPTTINTSNPIAKIPRILMKNLGNRPDNSIIKPVQKSVRHAVSKTVSGFMLETQGELTNPKTEGTIANPSNCRGRQSRLCVSQDPNRMPLIASMSRKIGDIFATAIGSMLVATPLNIIAATNTSVQISALKAPRPRVGVFDLFIYGKFSLNCNPYSGFPKKVQLTIDFHTNNLS
jgi:hypothetical protein